ncbi:MAG TPA: Type 1 glutamine amidotransferase-like domain-containing protein [Longimicrobiales bacterium]|nr:Type 1 glutamine amidotransferase-like domain-containing protein [Longimicrobiales bacterium]
MHRIAVMMMALALLVAPAPAQEVGPTNGSLVVVGGALRDGEIVRRFIQLAGGPHAPIVVVPTAGGADDYGEYCSCLDFLRENGATNLSVVHTYDPAEADSDAFIAPIRAARGGWFRGGRQWRLVDAYGGTASEDAFREVLDRGGVIGGSSAGASIQGSLLVRGDTESNTVMLGDHQRGFGYLRNVGVDQHLLMRNRQFDMLEVLEAHPNLLGIGLDENTAIVVQGDDMEVMGQGYVAIYDGGAGIDTGGGFYFLAPGDRFDLAARIATRPGRTYRPLDRVQRRGGADTDGEAGVRNAVTQERPRTIGTATPGPVIEPYGAVFDVVGLEVEPETHREFRILFDVADSPLPPGEVNPNLNTLARFLNMNARAGVPLERMHLALILHGSAAKDALAEEAFRERYDADNPNADLLRKLAAAGVEIYMCGQSAMSRDLPGDELVDGVQMALSAMNARSMLQARGYEVVN